MTVENVVAKKEITEVVHFTTHSGLLGVLHSGHVLSRDRLPNEVELEHIYQPNAFYRKDTAWLDYVNLSISEINHKFFHTSCRWHRESDLWWCILGFDPVILSHPGVVFATTNNMYSGVQRASGVDGFKRLFDPTIELWAGNQLSRSQTLLARMPTCPQAEALYPESVPTTFLRNIYVTCDDDADEVHAQLGMTGYKNVVVSVDPSRFSSQRGL